MSDTQNPDVTADTASSSAPVTGRNEPCPCGSGKKYKRCHGVAAAPKLSTPKAAALPEAGGMPAAPGGLPPGFDPSQMNPEMMKGVMQAMQRLPKGQLQRLQSVMQKAMAGKDVSKEAAELERTLPPGFQDMMRGFSMQAMMGQAGMGQNGAAPAGSDLSDAEARAIVEKAMKEGKMSAEEGAQLLATPPQEKKAGFWAKLTGKASK